MYPPHPQKSRNSFRGFTLAELLISLAILGVIATFIIPKIITSQQDAKRIAILKESIGALSSIFYQGSISGEMTDSTVNNYIQQHLNAIQLCPNGALTDGCVTQPVPHVNYQTYPGFVLANGANGSCGRYHNGKAECLIDWNGTDSPNVQNEDQYIVFGIYSASASAFGRIGTVVNNSGRTTDAVWANLFAN